MTDQALPDYPHEVYCNADRRLEIGCPECSCRAGREIKRLRALLTRPTPSERPVAQAREALVDIIRKHVWYAEPENMHAAIEAAAEEIALTSERPSEAAVACDPEASIPTYGNLPWDQLGRDVMESLIGRRRDFAFDPKFYPGHQSPGLNFNSLARIIDKYRLPIPHGDAVRAQTIEECAKVAENYGDTSEGSRNNRRRQGIATAIRALSPTLASERVSERETATSVPQSSKEPT